MKSNQSILTIFVATGFCFFLHPAWSMDANDLEANKKKALDFFRVVFEAENAEAAKDFMTDDYLEHNPKEPSGGGCKQFIEFLKTEMKVPKPVKEKLENEPASVIAEGDMVWIMWKNRKPDPKDKSKSYDAYWFDAFRFKHGKISEHWDAARR